MFWGEKNKEKTWMKVGPVFVFVFIVVFVIVIVVLVAIVAVQYLSRLPAYVFLRALVGIYARLLVLFLFSGLSN